MPSLGEPCVNSRPVIDPSLAEVPVMPKKSFGIEQLYSNLAALWHAASACINNSVSCHPVCDSLMAYDFISLHLFLFRHSYHITSSHHHCRAGVHKLFLQDRQDSFEVCHCRGLCWSGDCKLLHAAYHAGMGFWFRL